MVIPAKVGIQKIRKPSSFVPLGRGQGEDGKRGYRRQKTGGRRQFHAAASNVQNIHPRPAEAGYPRRPFDRLRVNGGVSGMRFASLSFILCPLSFVPYPFTCLFTRAGLPATMAFAGTSLVTTQCAKHPPPAPFDRLRAGFDEIRVNGGISGIRFASLSFILYPLSFILYPLSFTLSPVFSPVPGCRPRWHLPVRL
jgi:hypothetical protein